MILVVVFLRARSPALPDQARDVMVVLKLVVRLILEKDYARLGENAPGKKFLEIVKDPENTLVGQFVNHFKSRYLRECKE